MKKFILLIACCSLLTAYGYFTGVNVRNNSGGPILVTIRCFYSGEPVELLLSSGQIDDFGIQFAGGLDE